MADPIVPDCGKTLKTATPVDVSGYSEMWWQNDEYKEGFVASHEGPCEGWVDDEQIFYHENCAAKFKGYPAKVPADYSSCKGECLFVFYWFALHEPNWQIYKQCVPITNNGSGASTTTQSSGEKESSTSKDNGTSDTPASSDDGGSGATQTNTDNGTSDTPASVDNGGSDTTQTTTDSASDETEDGGSTENEGSGTGDEASGTDDEGSGAEQTTPAPESVEAPSTPSTEESNAPEPATPESPEVTPATPATDTTSTKCSARRRH
ncbi:hypothetical protein PHMEG_00025097 [Phytophthora megakarya]|uniref:Uncharacterized protein n=1 Tax=Phytophthora megakarya TaxID=4795 RepID=A0A225VD07_9STRA|nr:hypothetical protein PHMEG_00025097 [Phytophthora megakarya]